MPFTPFHLGPGVAIKAVAGRRFSLVAFGYSQVLMDLQPLYVMLGGDGALHGWTHSYLGAVLVGTLAFVTAKPLFEFLLTRLRLSDRRDLERWGLYPEGGRYEARSMAVGAYVGSLSHVFLDSIMHADVEPFFPFTSRNPLAGTLSIPWLHYDCVMLAGFGLALWLGLRWRRRA